jgi:outer membrane protein assembly factor BamE (lipoprotein component of BamABCDE complex)
MPEELPAVYQAMLEEQRLLDDSAGSLESLSQQVVEHHQLALETARQLHALRQASADELTQLITESMHSLSMPHGVFAIEVAFDERHLTADGADHIEFRVTTNPGQPLQPIAKVASGGELSRIALAIQVITARKMETPALIFDEVDVGISGPTAAVVGKLLRQLGESTQVMCVTHLPQVAGCGHHHFFVCKETDGEMTETHMQPLDKRARCRSWPVCWAAAKSRATPWRTRKSCLRRKLFDFHRVIVNSKLPLTCSRRFPTARRSIIIGILQMSHVLLGPKRNQITMRCKTLTAAAAVLLMLTAGCSTLERVVYRPDINQGNYLAPNDVAKIRVGMTQQQVAYALGTPMMSDPFGTNTWFYVFRQEPGHQKVTQQTLTLTFNSGGVLTNIDNKPALTSQ